MERAIDVGVGVGHHLDRCDMELGARLVVLARLLAAEVVAHLHCRKAGIRHQSVFDDVTQIDMAPATCPPGFRLPALVRFRSEEHTSELQSLMRTSYAGFCLKKKKAHKHTTRRHDR